VVLSLGMINEYSASLLLSLCSGVVGGGLWFVQWWGAGNEPWVLRQSILAVATAMTAMTVGIHRLHFVEGWREIATSSDSVGSRYSEGTIISLLYRYCDMTPESRNS
jgi:hypothetical protein